MNDNRPIDDLLEALSCAPDEQIDHRITSWLSSLVGESYIVIATELEEILKVCVQDSLASDFAIMSIDCAWKMAKEQI